MAHADRDRVQTLLEELPAWFEALPLFRLPGSRPPDPSGVRGASDPARAPIDLTVLDLEDTRVKSDAEPTREDFDLDRRAGARRSGVLPTLEAWASRVDAELCDEGTPPAALWVEDGGQATVTGICSWLAARTGWISGRSWFAEFGMDLDGMLRDVRRACGDASVDETLTCLQSGCGWPAEEMADGAWYRCRGCGSAWSRMELHKRAERKKPISLAECARRAGVTERTLHNYRADGKIKPAARRGRRDLYDLDEIMTATMSLRYRGVKAAAAAR